MCILTYVTTLNRRFEILMETKMKKIDVGNPYNIVLSNRDLASQYMYETREEKATSLEMSVDTRYVNENNLVFWRKTTFKKRLKNVFSCVGSCIVLLCYVTLMIAGIVVCIILL